MKNICFSILFFSFCLQLNAIKPIVIPLWKDSICGTNNILLKEEFEDKGMVIVKNVSVPELYIYLPEGNSSTPRKAVVICPGGSYAVEAIDHEGFMFAEWLAQNGIIGAVLKYRLPNGNHNIPLLDAQQSMRVMKEHAQKWNMNPLKIGIAGFSAGGHLASTLGTHFTNDTKPGFMILFYPVISMENGVTHEGSKYNLLGIEKENPELQKMYSNHLHVTKETPKTILFLNSDDSEVTPINGINFYQELLKQKVNASLYVFPSGGHGWGMYDRFAYQSEWKKLLLKWFEDEI